MENLPFNTPLTKAREFLKRKPTLTQPQMLELSKQLPTIQKREKLSDLGSLASNAVEVLAAKQLLEIDPDPVFPEDPHGHRFVFRCFHIPRVANFLASAFQTERGSLPLFLAPLGFYAIACERTHLDWVMMLSKTPKNSYRGIDWEYKHFANDFSHLPAITEDWFLIPPEKFNAALERFDTWRKHAALSFNWCLYSNFQNSDAVFNFLRHEAKGLGSFLLKAPKWIKDFPGPLIAEIEHDFEVFVKSKGLAKMLRDKELATWLIEIWPLVLSQGWHYGEIAKLASRRFPRGGPVITASAIKARCESLALHLPKESRGRPPKEADSAILTPPKWMATRIKSFGMSHQCSLYPLRVPTVYAKRK